MRSLTTLGRTARHDLVHFVDSYARLVTLCVRQAEADDAA